MEEFILADISRLPAITFILFGWLLRVVALFVVPRNRPPTSGMAWLMLIFISPTLGWVAFLLIGSSKLPKNRQNLQARVDRYLEAIDQGDHTAKEAVNKKYTKTVDLAERLVHMPVAYCDRYEVISDYDEVFSRLAQDIDNAKEVVNVNFYIMVLDNSTEQVVAAIERAHKRGVSVYVLYDDYCRWSLRYRRRFKLLRFRLESAGVRYVASLPMTLSFKKYLRPDLRNHRKLVTIDHYLAYTGSQNLIDKTYHRKDSISYKELVVRLEGDIAKHIEIVFATDWLSETKENILLLDPTSRRRNNNTNLRVQVVPSGPGYLDENNLKVFTSLFYEAEKSITIVNPYFVPDDSLMTALTSAVKRGVRVVMLNSDVIDQLFVGHAQRSYYEQLLEAGVNIHLHKKPELVHSKFIVVDDEVSAVGSSNLDIRSLVLDSELTLLVYGEQFASSLQAIADSYLANSRQLDKQSWSARPATHKLFDNIARLTSSLQ